MKIYSLNIPDVLCFEPEIFSDNRGFFFESYNKKKYDLAFGRKINFVQENQSESSLGTLRGLHYQIPPLAQSKLVSVVEGEVFDVAIDIRKSSPTFGKHVSVVLSEKNKKQLYIPEGFAHGFLTLSKSAIFQYKTNKFYSSDLERGIIWNDPHLNILWPIEKHPILSAKDASNKPFIFSEFFK
ncbi:dTDP-4-dehydrorhamnose 3,5-epimerase [Candidatus Methylopumilus rimovensis]|uniref:dTDP-4-dehydrorhamnose 3,5-epimerase n=1 Tax=Candidatus Methylopumilus rimovensis TaxID=2588535 RepID=A0AAE6FSH5_9PROT|nr:dTDP-4-dehydrorhamnose 3,5-epimerase [Candidatus Methylopumilus rimovensis]QDD13354.1 dTDP-4-dehydrorhamnose 3,5-epimerase [Candidatus Methylopumilus rimovensis]